MTNTGDKQVAIPPAALELITRFEGGPHLTPYDDGTGVMTVGWGHTGRGAQRDEISEEDAAVYLKQDLREAFDGIVANVSVPLNENQLSALLSFVFNLGVGRLRKSTLLRLLNGGDYRGAADEFQKWKVAGGKTVTGLVRRRAAEEQLFRMPPTKRTTMTQLSAKDVLAVLTTGEGGDLRSGMEDAVILMLTQDAPLWMPMEKDGGLVA